MSRARELTDPLSGPDGILDVDRPPSRGDWHAIALLALKVLKIKAPTNRFEATGIMLRLAKAARDARPADPGS